MRVLGDVCFCFGVQVLVWCSDVNLEGDLIIVGDIDLFGYCYGFDVDCVDLLWCGFGELVLLVLRVEGNINVYGSINDGFVLLLFMLDEGGWQLYEGCNGSVGYIFFGGGLVVLVEGVKLQFGIEFQVGICLNYDVLVELVMFLVGIVLFVLMVILQILCLFVGMVLGVVVIIDFGQMLVVGIVLQELLMLVVGVWLGVGFCLCSVVQVVVQEWFVGVVLLVVLCLVCEVVFKVGVYIFLLIKVELFGDVLVNLWLVDVDGNQGCNWVLVLMLVEGIIFWDLIVVVGVDVGVVDLCSWCWGSEGSVVLVDIYQGLIGMVKMEIIWVGDCVLIEWVLLDWIGDIFYVGCLIVELVDMFGFIEDEFCVMLVDYCGLVFCQVVVQGLLDYWGDEFYVGIFVKDFVVMFGMIEDEFCSIVFIYCVGGGMQIEVIIYGKCVGMLVWSVLCIGKGDMELFVVGDVVMKLGFGVYIVGIFIVLGGGCDVVFNLFCVVVFWNIVLLGLNLVLGCYDVVMVGYQVWYLDCGGNLCVEVGCDIVGDVWIVCVELGSSECDWVLYFSVVVGNWLWCQGIGGMVGVELVLISWWVNFGIYINVFVVVGSFLWMVGFIGFGILGGGDLMFEVGCNVGVCDLMGDVLGLLSVLCLGVIIVVVGLIGWVSDGQLYLIGGGDLWLCIGGVLNLNLQVMIFSFNFFRVGQNFDFNGILINLCGSLQFDVGCIGVMGVILESYVMLGQQCVVDLFVFDVVCVMGGLVLVLGDVGVQLQVWGDVVFGGVVDVGWVLLVNYSVVLQDDGVYVVGSMWFFLWMVNMVVDLFSVGGDFVLGFVGLDNVIGSNLWCEQVQFVVCGGDDLLNYWFYFLCFSVIVVQGDIKLDWISVMLGMQDVILLVFLVMGWLDVLVGGSIFVQCGVIQIVCLGVDVWLLGFFDFVFLVQQGDFGGNVICLWYNFLVDGNIVLLEVLFLLFVFGFNILLFIVFVVLVLSCFYVVQGDIIGLVSGVWCMLDFNVGQCMQLNWFEVVGVV